MRRLKSILRSRYLFKVIVFMCLVYSLIVNNFIVFNSKYNVNDTYFEVIVDKMKIEGNKLSLDVIGFEKLKLVYYFKNIKEIENIDLGDEIRVEGVLDLPSSNTIFNTFDYKKYLYNNYIYYVIKAKKIEKIKSNTSLIYDVRNRIDIRLKKASKSYSYLKTFILGNKDDIDSIMDSYYDLGISHMFSISGMHISLIVGLLLFVLNRISYNKYYNYMVVITVLIIYGIILDYPASVFRTIVMFVLFAINKLFNFKVKSLDIMLLVLSICLIINPLIINNIGFVFSYLISFSLIMLAKKISKIKNKLFRSLYISYVCFVVSMPVCIYNFYQVNVISIVLNVIVIPLVSVVIFPLSIITFIFPLMDNVLYTFILILEFISRLVNKIEISKIIFAKPSIFVIFIYYIIIYLMFKNKKYIILFFVIVIIHKNIIYFNNSLNVIFMDVGQGDSSLVIYPHNKLNILVDTGGMVNSSYSIIKNKTIPYLKSNGINRVDYLLLSHGDYDHMGEAINLVENFKVEKVIFNCGPYNDLEKELIKVLDKKHIKYYSCIKELNIDNNKLYFLQTKEYDNENDNSNVIYTKLKGYKFMFMGDASSTTEEEILEKYNLTDIDVLKVGHHGSRTSSGKEFINEINPRYSVISVGKNNRYGHPNKEVLNNLDNSKIYRTDEDGSIMFKIKNNKLKIETCSP